MPSSAPLLQAVDFCPPAATRDCPALPDEDLLRLALIRYLVALTSGPDLLQTDQIQTGLAPVNFTFFEALNSTRRLEYFRAMFGGVHTLARRSLPDALAPFPCFDGWDLYAADGHFWEAAAHDKQSYRRGGKDNQAKFATGNIFSLCLRTHTMARLVLGNQESRRKEYDVSAIKRLEIKALRQGAAAGRKVLSDEIVTGGPVTIRKVVYQDPATGERYEYITKVMDTCIPPGIIAMLYKLRWDIEKTFDATTIKQGESKAWASPANAKRMQAEAVCLTHNMMLLYKQKLEHEEDIRNVAEIKRRADRLEELEKSLGAAGRRLDKFVKMVQCLTQRSVNFIRWLKTSLPLRTPPAHADDDLRHIYRRL